MKTNPTIIIIITAFIITLKNEKKMAKHSTLLMNNEDTMLEISHTIKGNDYGYSRKAPNCYTAHVL